MNRLRELSQRPQVVSAVTVLLVVAALIGFGATSRPGHVALNEGPGVQALRVLSATVDWVSGYTVTRSFVGRVEARQESDIGFEVPGKVASVAVEEGEVVKKGDLLARLDSERLRARRAELVAALEQASAREQLARSTLRRVTEALEKNAVSTQRWDDADKAHLEAKARLSLARAAVASIDVDIEKTTLRSPFDAVVAARYVDAGRVIDAGTPVLRVLERSRPEVRIGVGGSAIDSIRVGQPMDVTIGDRTVDGVVSAILPTRDRVDRAVDVVITLRAQIDGLRSGDLARVRIDRTVDERGFWVPIPALTEGVRGLWSVYSLEVREESEELARLERTEVEVLHQETDRVFVRGPLSAGERVAVAGLHRIAAGMIVRHEGNGSNPAAVSRDGS